MHIEFLVEEPSAESALRNLVPKIIGDLISFEIHPFQGKPDLLKKLPGRLRGYYHWLPEDWRIVVLIDEDRQDCRELKGNLEQIARDAGLVTCSEASEGRSFQVLNRIAIEELEAWFFGNVEAIHQAYPRIPLTLSSKARYIDPDAITGGTWEALEREFKKVGYFRNGLAKIEVAISVSVYMDPNRNRSKSFQVFRRGLLKIMEKESGSGPHS